MKMNPLFASVEEGFRLDVFARSLGFESKVVTLDREDLSEDDAAEYEKDAVAWLDKWQPEAPKEFFPAGAFDTEDGPVALFVKPVTKLASAMWLLGSGQAVQQEPVSTGWGYHVSDDEMFTGWFSSRKDAESEGEQAAKDQDCDHYETALFSMSPASRYVDADDVLTTMMERSSDECGECADDWPDYTKKEEELLNDALSLLVDGWARQTENDPTFSSDSGENEEHAVDYGPLGRCGKCSDPAVGFNDDGSPLCSDCIFEESVEGPGE